MTDANKMKSRMQPETQGQMQPQTQADMVWPPLIYSAHVPLLIRVRDFLITALGWLLVIDLLEDIWVLMTQWLHVNVFRRTVELEHMAATFWGNIHQFFYLSFAFAAVILLVGLSRYRQLSMPLQSQADMGSSHLIATAIQTPPAHPARLTRFVFDEHGQLLGVEELG